MAAGVASCQTTRVPSSAAGSNWVPRLQETRTGVPPVIGSWYSLGSAAFDQPLLGRPAPYWKVTAWSEAVIFMLVGVYGELLGSRSVTPEPSSAPDRMVTPRVRSAGAASQSSRPPASTGEARYGGSVPLGVLTSYCAVTRPAAIEKTVGAWTVVSPVVQDSIQPSMPFLRVRDERLWPSGSGRSVGGAPSRERRTRLRPLSRPVTVNAMSPPDICTVPGDWSEDLNRLVTGPPDSERVSTSVAPVPVESSPIATQTADLPSVAAQPWIRSSWGLSRVGVPGAVREPV